MEPTAVDAQTGLGFFLEGASFLFKPPMVPFGRSSSD